MKTWILAILLVFGAAFTATAQDRHALVVGIDAYVNITNLQKARNDAEAVAEALGETGFEVTVLLDSNRRDLFRALNTFVQQLEPGDEAVFYFAGHGVEVDGRNYLLPTDVPAMRPGEERLLTSESLAADAVLADMQGSGARVSLLILDACRDNPFPEEGTRSLGRSAGLARLEAPEGAFIMFSAGTGQTALDRLSNDDPDPNSVFTRALLPLLTEPGLPIHQIARRLRRDVQDLAQTVGYDQRPAYYDEVTGDFFFRDQVTPPPPDDAEIVVIPTPTPTPGQLPGPTATNPCTAARADWAIVETTSSVTVLQAYRETHARCAFLDAMAGDRIATLQAEVAAAQSNCASAGTVWAQLSTDPEFNTGEGIVVLEDYAATYRDCTFYTTLARARIDTLIAQEEERNTPQHFPRSAGGQESCSTFNGGAGPGAGTRAFCVSSVLAPQGSNSYWPFHMFDENFDTAWNEGSSGRGEGETLAWDFVEPTQVNRIRIINGYIKTNRTFTRNGRVQRVRITGSTGYAITHDLSDISSWQTIDLAGAGEQQWIQIEIVSIYRGTHYADLAITELRIE